MTFGNDCCSKYWHHKNCNFRILSQQYRDTSRSETPVSGSRCTPWMYTNDFSAGILTNPMLPVRAALIGANRCLKPITAPVSSSYAVSQLVAGRNCTESYTTRSPSRDQISSKNAFRYAIAEQHWAMILSMRGSRLSRTNVGISPSPRISQSALRIGRVNTCSNLRGLPSFDNISRIDHKSNSPYSKTVCCSSKDRYKRASTVKLLARGGPASFCRIAGVSFGSVADPLLAIGATSSHSPATAGVGVRDRLLQTRPPVGVLTFVLLNEVGHAQCVGHIG